MLRRKARNISSKLGINKADNNRSATPDVPVLIKVDSVSSSEGLIDDDTSSSQESNEDPQQLLTTAQSNKEDNRPQLTHCKSAPCYDDGGNLELLLSIEVQERLQEQKERAERQEAPPRPTRIRFDLPQKPQRSKSPTAIAYPKARPVRSFNEEDMVINQSRHPMSTKNSRPRRSGWRLFGDDDDDNRRQLSLPIYIGSRVRLKMRPLPTFGYVKYIGPVDGFGSGEYIGVELDFGVGDCDGTVNGKKYFESEGKRGIFLQRRELEAVQQQQQQQA